MLKLSVQKSSRAVPNAYLPIILLKLLKIKIAWQSVRTISVCDLWTNYSLWPRGSQNTQKVFQHQKLHKLARTYTLKGEAERPHPWNGEKRVATVDLAQKLQGCLCKVQSYLNTRYHPSQRPRTNQDTRSVRNQSCIITQKIYSLVLRDEEIGGQNCFS